MGCAREAGRDYARVLAVCTAAVRRKTLACGYSKLLHAHLLSPSLGIMRPVLQTRRVERVISLLLPPLPPRSTSSQQPPPPPSAASPPPVASSSCRRPKSGLPGYRRPRRAAGANSSGGGGTATSEDGGAGFGEVDASSLAGGGADAGRGREREEEEEAVRAERAELEAAITRLLTHYAMKVYGLALGGKGFSRVGRSYLPAGR